MFSKNLVQAKNQSRSGCFVIADMGSFYLFRMVKELMKYEAFMPLKFDVKHFVLTIKKTLICVLRMKNNCYSNIITEIS